MNALRTRVVWFGAVDDNFDDAHFTSRGLSLEKHAHGADVPNLANCRAVIYRYNPAQPGDIVRWLRDIAPTLLNHGVRVQILTDAPADFTFVGRQLNSQPLVRSTANALRPALSQVAENTARCPPQRLANHTLKIEGPPSDPLCELLLQRAFNDCEKIILEPLPGGRCAKAFAVRATFSDSLAGPMPLPFFAKFGDEQKISRELKKYREYVDHFVPFNLRPHVDHDRCLLTPTRGLLVGTFVSRSSSLRVALARGDGSQPIHALFEETLAGWSLQAHEESNKGLSKGNFFAELRNLFRPDRIAQERIQRAMEMGASLTPPEFITALQALPELAFRQAPVHGDLHAENVRVRGIDSIVIDFESVRHGPIVTDKACLEVSILFTAANDSNDGWRPLIDTLYRDEHLQRAPPPPLEPSKREWVWSAVRQIRLLAASCEETCGEEYQRALIYSLLRRAGFQDNIPIEEERGDYAYVIAERLLKSIQKRRR